MPSMTSLPPELLRHIFIANLSYEHRDDLRLLLLQTSLVCRAWRDISQDGLWHETVILRDGEMAERYTEQLRREKVDKRIRWLTVSSSGVLEKLDDGTLLATTSLAINAPLFGDFNPPASTTLPLTHLTLQSWRLVPRSILEPLLAAAPNLTSLQLAWDEADDFSDALMAIAPQLHHLLLETPPPDYMTLKYDGGGEALDFSAFLSACTSLRSFRLVDYEQDRLYDTINPITCPLVVLELSFGIEIADEEGPGGEMEADSYEPLMRMLKGCKALKALKRWRLGCMEDEHLDCPGMKQQKEAWMMECEKRGIEVRGMERRMTD